MEFVLRIIVAAICGGFIGYERRSRLKEAGTRTHVIVAIGSCLIMIVSKYGFNDVALLDIYKVDAARLAAQVVSGVGFLGAGMILIRKNVILGLTTAAGIWATSGIGLAIGAGMIEIGVFTTALILGFQFTMHEILSKLRKYHNHHVSIEIEHKANIKQLNAFIESKGIKILEFQFQHNKNSYEIIYSLGFPKDLSEREFIEETSEIDYILSVDI